MEKFNLCLANTFIGGEDTFHGRAASSRMDYLGVPRDWFSIIVDSCILNRRGRQFQMAPVKCKWDHYPLQ
eukprot:975506-Pyramimonas_sp.AAC.1